MPIELSVFQEIAVNRVTNYCNNLEGILLMHEVGTGKTITSLAMGINSIDWSLKIGDETINTIDELECVDNEYDEIHYIFTGKPHKGVLKFGGETNNNYLGPNERNNCEIEFITKNPGRVIVILHPTGLFGNFSDEINKFDLNVVEMDIARWDTIFREKPFVNSNVFNHLMKTANYPDETVCRLRRKFVKTTEIDGQRIERTYWKTFYIISRIYKHIKGSFFRSLPIVGMKEMQKYLNERILIIDEAHRLLNPILATGPSMIDYILNYNGCSSCRKIIAMSGTPIKSNILDLVRMIQFVTQKDSTISNEFNLNFTKNMKKFRPDYNKFESAVITALNQRDLQWVNGMIGALYICGKRIAKKLGNSIRDLVYGMVPTSLTDLYFQESITKIIVYNNALYYKYMWYLNLQPFTRTYFVGKKILSPLYYISNINSKSELLTIDEDTNLNNMIDTNIMQGGDFEKFGFLNNYKNRDTSITYINVKDNDTKKIRIDNFYKRSKEFSGRDIDKDLDSVYARFEDELDYLHEYYAIKNNPNRESKKCLMRECRQIIEKYALHYPVNYENLYDNINKYISFISAEMPIISNVDISDYSAEKTKLEKEISETKIALKEENIKKEVFGRIKRKNELIEEIKILKSQMKTIAQDNGRNERVIEITNNITELEREMNSIGLRDLKDLFPQEQQATPLPEYLSSVLQSSVREDPINFSPTYVSQFTEEFIDRKIIECNEKILELQTQINISKDKINKYKKRTGDYVYKYLNDDSTKIALKEIDKSIRYVYPQKVVEIIYTPYVSEQTYFYHRVNKQIVSKLESPSNYQPHIPWYMVEDDWKDSNLMKRCASNYSLDVDYKAIKYNTIKNEYEYYVDTQGESWFGPSDSQDNPQPVSFKGTKWYSINKIENGLTYSCPKFEKILAMLFINKYGLNYNYHKPDDEEGNKTIESQKIKRLILNKILTKQAHFVDGNTIFADKNHSLNDSVFTAFCSNDLDDDKTANTLNAYNTSEPGNIEPTINRLKNLNSIDYNDNRTHCFLPLVYSTSDVMGLNLFAAFLKKKKINYIILHDDAIKNNLELMKTLSFSAAYHRFNLSEISREEYEPKKILSHLVECVQENNKIEENIMNFLKGKLGNEPLCILLHPLMTEGLDAKYNPAIYLLESPKMYSDYDQLCGRVLRTIRPGYKNKKIKNVYQCLGYTHAGVTDLINEYFAETVDYKLGLVGNVSHGITNAIDTLTKLGSTHGGYNTKKNKPLHKMKRVSRKYIGGNLKTKNFSINEGINTRYHLDDDIASVTTLFFDVENSIVETNDSDNNSKMSGTLSLVYLRSLLGSFNEYNFLKPKDNLFMTLEPNLLINAYFQKNMDLDTDISETYESVIRYLLWTDYIQRIIIKRTEKLMGIVIDLAKIYVEVCIITAVSGNVITLLSKVCGGISMGLINIYNSNPLKFITDTIGTGRDILNTIFISSAHVAFDITLSGIGWKLQTYMILRQNLGLFTTIASLASYGEFLKFSNSQETINYIRSLTNNAYTKYANIANMQLVNGFYHILSTITSNIPLFGTFSLNMLNIENLKDILSSAASSSLNTGGSRRNMIGGNNEILIEYLKELNEYIGFYDGIISIDKICKYYFDINENVDINIVEETQENVDINIVEETQENDDDNEKKLINYPSKYIINAKNFEKVNINMFKNIIRLLLFQKTFIMMILNYINLAKSDNRERELKEQMDKENKIGIYFSKISKTDELINIFNSIEYDKIKRDYEIILTDNYIFLKYGDESNNSYEDSHVNRIMNQLTNAKLCIIYTIMNIVSHPDLKTMITKRDSNPDVSRRTLEMLSVKHKLIESAIQNGTEILINNELNIINNRIVKILKPIIEKKRKEEEAHDEITYGDEISKNKKPQRTTNVSSISEEEFNNIITTLNNDNTRDDTLINDLLRKTKIYIETNIKKKKDDEKKDHENKQVNELIKETEIKKPTLPELVETLKEQQKLYQQYQSDTIKDVKNKFIEEKEQVNNNMMRGGYRTNENWLYKLMDKLRIWNGPWLTFPDWITEFKYIYTIYTSYGFPYISKYNPSIVVLNRNKFQTDFINFIKYKIMDIYTAQFNITKLDYKDGDINALIDEIPSREEISDININQMRDDLTFFINICKNEYHYNKIKDMIKNEAKYPYIQDVVAIKECGNPNIQWCNPLTNDSTKICTNNTGINSQPTNREPNDAAAAVTEEPTESRNVEESITLEEPTGEPTYTYKGNKYYGEIGNTKLPNGEGIMLYANGDKFKGTWVNNKKQKGIYRYQDGDSSQGNWVYDGKKDVRDGKHKYTKIWGPSEFGGFVDDRISETVNYLHFDKGTIIGTYETADDTDFTRLAPFAGRVWVLANGFHGGKRRTRKHKGGKKSKKYGKNKKHGRTKYKRTNKKTRKLQK
jgi:hypothetical protein